VGYIETYIKDLSLLLQSQPKCPKTLRCSFGARSRNQIEILTTILKKVGLETLDPDLTRKNTLLL